ncbi:hypothetical protein EDC04DRAFT_1221341 [Pisolithus marmoratus]|nr:hypothetical protein EDC04DRAFT_1221341 [Pisolithus marmoratus]
MQARSLVLQHLLWDPLVLRLCTLPRPHHILALFPPIAQRCSALLHSYVNPLDPSDAFACGNMLQQDFTGVDLSVQLPLSFKSRPAQSAGKVTTHIHHNLRTQLVTYTAIVTSARKASRRRLHCLTHLSSIEDFQPALGSIRSSSMSLFSGEKASMDI